MIITEADNTPSLEACFKLLEQYEMLPNIIEHSRQVLRVATVICNNLIHPEEINIPLTLAAALLHDITKTSSLKTHEQHDLSGQKLLTEIGYPEIGKIVGEHIDLLNYDPNGPLLEKEIVFYADKRVQHNLVVSIDQRMDDLIVRYGHTADKKIQIELNRKLGISLENKITRHLTDNIDHLLQIHTW